MTSVGVISSAVARINRLKDLRQKEFPKAPSFNADGVLGRLEDVKGLLVTAYGLRKEEAAEAEIKEVVQLSYEVVNVIVDSLDHNLTIGVKKLNDLEEKLGALQHELTIKIQPGSSDITANPTGSTLSKRAGQETKPKVRRNALVRAFRRRDMQVENSKIATGSDAKVEITSSPKSAAGSPRSKQAGPDTKPKGNILGIQVKGSGNALEKVGNFISNKLATNSQKSTAGLGSGSDSDPLVGSKSPLTTESTTGSDIQEENESSSTTGSGALIENTAAGLEPKPEAGTSEILIQEDDDKGSLVGPDTKPKGNILGIQVKGSGNAFEKVGNFISNKLAINSQKSTTGSVSGSDSDPLVGSESPMTTESTTGSESQVENLEITTGSDIHVKKKSPIRTTGSGTLKEHMVAGLEPKSETGTSEILIQEDEDKGSLVDQIKTDLMSKPKAREVYIVGKSGMGKSALARKLYNDPDIRKPFDVFGWVTAGHNFQIKRVLQLLLQLLQGPGHEQTADMMEMNETELIAQIFSVVHNKSYLLVLEDLGSVKDWESISLALPIANSTRVIITSSSDGFLSFPHSYTIPGLTRVETLALLNKGAVRFGRRIGEAIYDISGGSPLYTTILGKSLEPEADDPLLYGELISYKPKRGTPQVIDASYRRLDHELKPCFLYLGLFPPGQHIQVDKLYLLLLAENLIPSPKESFKAYLDKLAGLKLVEVEEDVLSRNDLYKSCRLHQLVQEFCRSKGLDEEFLEVVDFKSSKQVVGSNTRRLGIYIRNYRGGSPVSFQDSATTVKKILSLLVFDAIESSGEGKPGWPSGVDDLTEFTHLRVLNFDEVNFRARKLPMGLEKLKLLRFLSFRGCFLEELPSSLGSLKQVEALDLLVRDDCCITIPDSILANMKRMVHLYLPRVYRSNGKKKLTLGMEMLETLVNFDTEVFDVGDLSQLKRLKILSTISNGESPEDVEAVIDLLNDRKEELRHSSMEIRNFDCYSRGGTSALKKLMQCRFVHSVRIEGEIGELPAEEDEDKAECGERSIAEMVLHGSELEDDPMGYFGKFKNLLSLVLEDDAFMGTEILISPSPLFGKLRSLKLRNLQYLEKLTIEEGALPQLSSLQIGNCGDELDLTIPKELYDRLKNEIGGDAYSVAPSPSKFKTTP